MGWSTTRFVRWTSSPAARPTARSWPRTVSRSRSKVVRRCTWTSSSCTRRTVRRPTSRWARRAETGLLEAEVPDPRDARARFREETGCARRAAPGRARFLAPHALSRLAAPLKRFLPRVPPLAERVAQALVRQRDHENAVVAEAATLAFARVRRDP